MMVPITSHLMPLRVVLQGKGTSNEFKTDRDEELEDDGKTLPLPCVSTAFAVCFHCLRAVEEPPLPCVPTAFAVCSH